MSSSMFISQILTLLCRDDNRGIDHSMDKLTGDALVVVAEIIAIHEALRMEGHLKLENLLMSSNVQILINPILDKIKFLIHISNLVLIL